MFINGDTYWCITVHVSTTYFTLTTYFWMLCEGAYLQLLLMDAFHDDKKRVRILFFVGWILPLLVVIPYYFIFYNSEKCWAQFEEPHLFLTIPVVIIITLNIFFLSNVIRLLRSKLEADAPTQPLNRRNTKFAIYNANMKQAKAALFLIPILGINYLLFPFRPEESKVYDILSAITTSFQGFFVALLLCLTNSEVINIIQKRWNQFAVSRNLNISFTHLVTIPFNSRSDHVSEV